MTLSNSQYNLLKQIAQIYLPGVGALYFALAGIWGLPNAEQVVGTITAVDVFLGLILAGLSKSYANSDAAYDGDLVVEESEDGTLIHNLELNDDGTDLAEKDSITFKVRGNDG